MFLVCVRVCVCTHTVKSVKGEMTSEVRVAGAQSLRWLLRYLCRCLWAGSHPWSGIFRIWLSR